MCSVNISWANRSGPLLCSFQSHQRLEPCLCTSEGSYEGLPRRCPGSDHLPFCADLGTWPAPAPDPSAWGNHYFLFDLSAADSCLNLNSVPFSPITFFFLLLARHSITQNQFPPNLHPPLGKIQAKARFRSKDMGVQNQVLSIWTRGHSRHRNCNWSSRAMCEPLHSLKRFYLSARPGLGE